MAFVIAAAAILLSAVLVAIVTGVFGWGRSAVGPGSALLVGLVAAELLFGAGLFVTRPTSDIAEDIADIPFEPAPLPAFTPGPTAEATAAPAPPRRRRTTAGASPAATPTVPPRTAAPPVITEPDPGETPEPDDICPADNPSDPDCEDHTPEPPPTASP